MSLDGLIAEIETIRARIEKHRNTLAEYEIRTRTALVDPMLRALGWDPSDPSLVCLEMKLPKGDGRADYVLLYPGPKRKPAVIIETKKLDLDLENLKIQRQLRNYAYDNEVNYAALTDGDRWQLYKVFEQREQDRLVASISLTTDAPPDCALQLQWLWRSNHIFGGQARQPITPLSPIVQPVDELSPPDPPPLVDAILLSSLTPATHDKAPLFVICPDGSYLKTYRHSEGRKPKGHWNKLLMQVFGWLVDQGHFKEDDIPFSRARNKYLVDRKPIMGPRNPKHDTSKVVRGYYLATHAKPRILHERALLLIDKFGQDLPPFRVSNTPPEDRTLLK